MHGTLVRYLGILRVVTPAAGPSSCSRYHQTY